MKDEKLQHFWDLWKNPSFRGGFHEEPIYRGGFPKKGGLGQFTDLTGGMARKRGVVFLRGLG